MLGIEPGNKGWAVRFIRQCEDQFGGQKEDNEGEGEPGGETIRCPIRIVLAGSFGSHISPAADWGCRLGHRSRRCHTIDNRLILSATSEQARVQFFCTT